MSSGEPSCLQGDHERLHDEHGSRWACKALGSACMAPGWASTPKKETYTGPGWGSPAPRSQRLAWWRWVCCPRWPWAAWCSPRAAPLTLGCSPPVIRQSLKISQGLLGLFFTSPTYSPTLRVKTKVDHILQTIIGMIWTVNTGNPTQVSRIFLNYRKGSPPPPIFWILRGKLLRE